MDRLLQSIEDEPGMRGGAHAPADDLPGVSEVSILVSLQRFGIHFSHPSGSLGPLHST